MSRHRSLTPDQDRLVRERHLLHVRLRIEAAKHSPYALAKELGVSEQTVKRSLQRKVG